MLFLDVRIQRNCARSVTFAYLLFNYTFLNKLLPWYGKAYNSWLWYSNWDRTTAQEVDVLPGSCIIAPKEIWTATRGFDDRLPMYFSDDYFSRSVRQLGKKTAFLVSDGIVHYEGASTQRVSRWAQLAYFRDLLAYTRLVFGPLAQVTLAVLLIPTRVVQRIKVH